MKDQSKLDTRPQTRDGGFLPVKFEKTDVDRFIEDFGDDWPLEMVKFGYDDGGRILEIYCEESRASDLRDIIPHRYGEGRVSTVVIGVEEGFGA